MTDPVPDSPSLTTEHLCAFGAIIAVFARHEILMVGAISNLLETSAAGVMHLTAEMPYRAKKDALKALSKASDLKGHDKERIAWFLGQVHTFNDLRNSIAHNIWKRGERPGSIKPLSLGVRSGTTKIKGIYPTEPDYTLDELNAAVENLIRLQHEFCDYLVSLGLWPLKVPEESK